MPTFTPEQQDFITRAADFAIWAHSGQVRKYTGEPYFNHCSMVAGLVSGLDNSTPEMVAAALLHDTVEDCGVTLEHIETVFGNEVAVLVDMLTDVSTPEQGNRALRKAVDLRHTAQASPSAKTIKLADLIDNTSSIMAHDAEFAKVYMAEKRALLKVLTEGDATLLGKANQIVEDYFASQYQKL